MSYRLGFDIGGTFTDLVLVDDTDGTVHRNKVSTVPDSFADGAMTGIRQLCQQAGAEYDEISHISHGTTVATNALLERDGAKTGVLATAGFRDILAIGREKRSEIYDLAPTKTPTFAPRRHRREVPERVTADGEVIQPLDEDATVDQIRELEAAGVDSVAISLLHAYRHPEHEQRVAELVAEHSDMAVSVSSNVMSELNEYERTLSTTVDAYVNPILAAYIEDLSGRLLDLGISEPLHLMQANGGVITPETIGGRRLRLVNSGPAAGVLGAQRVGLQAGHEDLITLDMGGTSTDTCVVTDGEIEMTNQGGINDIPLLFAQIDVRSIGTGGGSIAQFDRTGVLKVGPQSVGAHPGPACYGRGGDNPTVTDATVHLGYLNPQNFLGGEMELDVAAAETALKSLAEQADIGVTKLSAGIHEIVATNMVGGIRRVTVEKGHDPRQFALVCYGGAGPLFGDTLARKLGVKRVLIPPVSGMLSAFGLLTADRRFDLSRSQPLLVSTENLSAIRRVRDDLREKAASFGSDLDFQWSVDMRYHGQTSDLSVDLPGGELNAADLELLVDRFESIHESTFGVVNEDDPVEALTWRLQAIDPTQKVELRVDTTEGSIAAAHTGTRKAYDRDGFTSFDVYSRYDLPHDTPVPGPAIIEEPEATTVVSGESEFVVDTTGTIVLSTE